MTGADWLFPYLMMGLLISLGAGKPQTGGEWFGAASVALGWPLIVIWALWDWSMNQ